MDLLAIGNQRVTRERQVVLLAGELSDTPNGAVDGAQARAVTLAPDHSLMVTGLQPYLMSKISGPIAEIEGREAVSP